MQAKASVAIRMYTMPLGTISDESIVKKVSRLIQTSEAAYSVLF